VPDELSNFSLVLAGPGRAGRAFARSWTGAGGKLAAVLARDLEAARRLASESGSAEALPLEPGGPLSCDVLAVAVSDDAIAPVARRLDRVACRFAFHFSGALPAQVLSPISLRGAATGSLHPLRAFTGAAQEDWRGAFVAVEGDAAAVLFGEDLARAIGARPRRLRAAGKALYHAAATLAAGGTASLLSVAARLWVEAGLEEEEGRAALAELAQGASRAVGQFPFDRCLTGPIARRDLATIRAHRDALAGRPEVLALYGLLARETLRRTPGRGNEQEIESLFGGGPAEKPRRSGSNG